jgi:hypothetical protein
MTDDDKKPPLNSPEWFRWVEGQFLDPDDPPVRYTKTTKTPAPQPRAPDWFSKMLRARHPDLTDKEIDDIFLSH